jgi:hypothetical protein
MPFPAASETFQLPHRDSDSTAYIGKRQFALLDGRIRKSAANRDAGPAICSAMAIFLVVES